MLVEVGEERSESRANMDRNKYVRRRGKRPSNTSCDCYDVNRGLRNTWVYEADEMRGVERQTFRLFVDLVLRARTVRRADETSDFKKPTVATGPGKGAKRDGSAR